MIVNNCAAQPAASTINSTHPVVRLRGLLAGLNRIGATSATVSGNTIADKEWAITVGDGISVARGPDGARFEPTIEGNTISGTGRAASQPRRPRVRHMYILGISAFYHDSAAALVVDGKIVAAAQEERFTRKKHDDAFPIHAIRYCMAEGGIARESLDAVVFYDKPLNKFERLLKTHFAVAPRGLRQFRGIGSAKLHRDRMLVCIEIQQVPRTAAHQRRRRHHLGIE